MFIAQPKSRPIVIVIVAQQVVRITTGACVQSFSETSGPRRDMEALLGYLREVRLQESMDFFALNGFWGLKDVIETGGVQGNLKLLE